MNHDDTGRSKGTESTESSESSEGGEAGRGGTGAEGPVPGRRGAGRAAPGLGQLQERLAEFAAARDWGQYHTPKNLAAALSVEASELLEVFQWLTPEQSAAVMADPDGAHRVTDEVADVLAYLLQFCAVLGIDPLAALDAKIDRNEARFPLPDAASDRR